MKNFAEMTRDELRQEASKRGIKGYITMSNLNLAKALTEFDERAAEIAAQLPEQDAKTKVQRVTEFYDELAEYGAVDLYSKVDGIVADREISDLEESELDEILALVPEFDKNNFKKQEPVSAAEVAAEEKPVKVKKEKKQSDGSGIASNNPLLVKVRELLAEGKKKSEIATILGKSNVYVYKLVKKIEAE